jgi:hypothetical protein
VFWDLAISGVRGHPCLHLRVETGFGAQVRQECALQQRRGDAAEAALDTERAAHRADMRGAQRQLADVQVRRPARSGSPCCAPFLANSAHLRLKHSPMLE